MQVKRLPRKEFIEHNDLVLALPNRIITISGGATAIPKQHSRWGDSGSPTEIKFDLGYKVASVSKAFPVHNNYLSTSILYKFLYRDDMFIISFYIWNGYKMDNLVMIAFIKLKNQVNSNKNMNFEKCNMHVFSWNISLMSCS